MEGSLPVAGGSTTTWRDSPIRTATTAPAGTALVLWVDIPIRGGVLVAAGAGAPLFRGMRRVTSTATVIGTVGVSLVSEHRRRYFLEFAAEGSATVTIFPTWSESNAADFQVDGLAENEWPGVVFFPVGVDYNGSALVSFPRAGILPMEMLTTGDVTIELWSGSHQTGEWMPEGDGAVTLEAALSALGQLTSDGHTDLTTEAALLAPMEWLSSGDVEIVLEGGATTGMVFTPTGVFANFWQATYVESNAADFFMTGTTTIDWRKVLYVQSDIAPVGDGLWEVEFGGVVDTAFSFEGDGAATTEFVLLVPGDFTAEGSAADLWEGAGLIEMQFDPVGTTDVVLPAYGVRIYSNLTQSQRTGVRRTEPRTASPTTF